MSDWAAPAGVSAEIAPDDQMYSGNLDHYLSVGQSALRCLRGVLALAGTAEPRSILDLPCGHGRVLRALRSAYPMAELTACDLNRDGVDFCVRTFNATGVYSHADPLAIPLTGPYDLIWCGSLLTHMSERRWEDFLQLFERVLTPGGLAVFTTHGRLTAAWLRQGRSDVGLPIEQMYGLTGAQATRVLTAYEAEGFGYVEFPGQIGYGLSLSAIPWVVTAVQRATSLRLVACLEEGWDNHQDVFACAKPQ